MESKLDGFLRYLEVEKGYSPGTIEAYRLDMGKGLIPFLHQQGKFRASEVTKGDIRAYLNFLASEKGNSNAARARKLAAIKSYFNYLVESEELGANPAASIRSPKLAVKKPVYLLDDECRRLLETVSQKAQPQVKARDTAIIVLFLHTGMRVSELVSLKLANVYLEESQIKVTRKRNKEQYLPLNAEAIRVLVQYMATRSEVGNGRLFTGTAGESLNRTYIYRQVHKYLKLSGIDKGKQGPHLLRHTFCTRLHHKGVGPFVIRDLAGHKSLATTMKYITIERKEQAEAVDRLEFGTL